MAVDIKKLVAAISPDAYCLQIKETFDERIPLRKNIKKMVSNIFEKLAEKKLSKTERGKLEKEAKTIYLKAAKDAELVESSWMDFDETVKSPFKLAGVKNPIEQHKVTYDASSESLEQVYFWLHDYLYNKSEYGEAKKLIDNFVSSPGSAHFSEMGMKATKMQEEAMKILGGINQIIKAILNLTYDLKNFKLALEPYKQLHSKNPAEKNAAVLSLKQRWLDQVDIKKGGSSIKALAVSGTNAPGFVMLIDAFMVVNSLEEIKALDLNDRMRRLLEQRFSEYLAWLENSEEELKKRFEIERLYLKSQYNNVQLYMRWVKPYLKAAAALEQRATATSALVTSFEISLFELVLLGIGDYKVIDDVGIGELPREFLKVKLRKYSPVVLVELNFRSTPERTRQGSNFRGKADITFTSFALNEDEIKVLEEQIRQDDLGDMLSLIEGSTTESLEQLKDDINEFLSDKTTDEELEEKKKEEAGEDTNPFSALLSIFIPEKKKESPKEKDTSLNPIKEDTGTENVIRSQAIIKARQKCRKLYDTFKKINGMPAF